MAEKHYSVLPLSRRGWVAGSDSFVGSLLKETGLFNAAGDLGLSVGGFASLEAIVSAKPDFLLVSQAGDHANARHVRFQGVQLPPTTNPRSFTAVA